MTIQNVPLTVRWHINQDTSVTLQVERSDGLIPQPVVQVTLLARQIILLQAEHACRAQGLVWTEEATP